jgi:LuxR family quorum-sensing system transcriptional regulator SolR
MKNWQEDQLHALLTTQCEHELFKELAAIARELEFDYCAYGLRTPLPISRPQVVMFNNYPPAWQARYQEKDYLAIDPTVHHGMRSLLPIIWTDDVFASARELWEDASSYGLRVGWAQSIHDAYGIGGMLTMARSDELLSEKEIRTKRLKMAWLTQVAHFGMSRKLTAKLMPETDIRLTDREVAVLRWTADGKTSSEISEILDISERTVNFHINNGIKKLGTVNKLAAAVRASVLGMLY